MGIKGRRFKPETCRVKNLRTLLRQLVYYCGSQGIYITGRKNVSADALPALVCLLLHVCFSSNNTCKWTGAVQTHVVLQSTTFLIHGWDSIYVEGHFKLYKDFPQCRWSAPLILVLFKGPL